ncbi:MAG: hypothetical protein K2K01_06785 [Eubacterium sp.]|nr:hypothetical protein [Eubacterium sp.]
MKYLGIILLNLSWIAAGFNHSRRLKRKCILSNELIEMCNLMAIELEFSVNETGKIIKRLSNEPTLSHLTFLQNISLENIDIKTELDKEDNERLNFLFKNIGKTDSSSMLNLIEAFKQNMLVSRKNYEDYYKSHSKLYIAFGMFGSLAVTLVLI